MVEIAKEMASHVTKKFKNPIELKFEKVYWPCILESKKRYFGYPWEGEYKRGKHPFEAKGIETVRRDGVQITQKIMMQVIRALFNTVIANKPFHIGDTRNRFTVPGSIGPPGPESRNQWSVPSGRWISDKTYHRSRIE